MLLDSLRRSVRPRCADSMNYPALNGATTTAGESALSTRVQAILGTAHRMRSPLPNARPRWEHKWGRLDEAESEVESLYREAWESCSPPDTLRGRDLAQ